MLVRYLAQDDPAQSVRAARLIERELSERDPGYISVVVLVEACRVLKRLYGATALELRETLRDLLDSRQLVVEQRGIVSSTLARLGEDAGDFADARIFECAFDAGCERTVTFDKAAAKLGMVLLR